MIVYYTYISLYQGNIGKIENHKIFRKSFSSANNIYYEHVLEEDSSNSQTLYCTMKLTIFMCKIYKFIYGYKLMKTL